MTSPTPAQIEELERRQRVSDQTASMHAMLRDMFGRRALLLELLLLAASIITATFALADLSSLGLSFSQERTVKLAIAISSTVIFIGTILASKVDWSAKAKEHERARQSYAALKLKVREALLNVEDISQSHISDLYREYDFSSSIMKCNTWGSRKVPANLSIYGKTI